MTIIFEAFAETPNETETWHAYKDGVSLLRTYRSWSLRALERLEATQFIAATAAIEAAYDEQEAHLKAKYLAVRRQLNIPPL